MFLEIQTTAGHNNVERTQKIVAVWWLFSQDVYSIQLAHDSFQQQNFE